MRWWIAGLGLAMWLAACSSPPAAQGVAPAATSPPIPTSNPNEPWKLTATAEGRPPVRATATARPSAAAVVPGSYRATINAVQDPYVAPDGRTPAVPTGQRLVAVDVTLQNTGAAGIQYTALYFKLRAADAREYAAPVTMQLAQGITGGTLNAGEAIRGWVGFAVPVDVRPTDLVYQPLLESTRLVVPLR